jgi:hypothetical protein
MIDTMAGATVRGSPCAVRDQRCVDRLTCPTWPNPPLRSLELARIAYDSTGVAGCS